MEASGTLDDLCTLLECMHAVSVYSPPLSDLSHLLFLLQPSVHQQKALFIWAWSCSRGFPERRFFCHFALCTYRKCCIVTDTIWTKFRRLPSGLNTRVWSCRDEEQRLRVKWKGGARIPGSCSCDWRLGDVWETGRCSPHGVSDAASICCGKNGTELEEFIDQLTCRHSSSFCAVVGGQKISSQIPPHPEGGGWRGQCLLCARPFD